MLCRLWGWDRFDMVRVGLGAILQVFWALRAVVFLGGVARIMPAAAVGWPIGLFVSVGSFELRQPPLFWFWAEWVCGKAL